MYPRFREISRANLDVVLLVAGVLLATSLGVVRTQALYENSLAVHPEWSSTKTTLRRGVMGALAFTSGQQALARNRLNLGAWFGFQEVLYRDAQDLAKLEFRFRVEPDGYLHLLYDHRADGFSGILLGSRPDSSNFHYRATADGEFTKIDPLAAERVSPAAWHQVALSFRDRDVVVTLDGATAGSFERQPGAQRVGFRGGQRNAEVDDVIFTVTDGRVRAERFTNRQRQGPRFALALAGLLSMTAVATVAALRFSSLPFRQIGMATAVVGLVLGCAVAATYLFQYVRGRDYGTAGGETARSEAYWIKSTRRDIVAGIRANYSAEIPPNVFRILVLGTSQTWGAGAVSEEATWVRQLERLLEERPGGMRVECINAGVSGMMAAQVLEMLRTDLAGVQATAALVNLSNNDVDTERFRRSLDAIAGELLRRKMRVVFALEPNSPERRATDSRHGDLAVKHGIVRTIAARYQRPVIDLHAYLAERRDAGFVWWDFVHLTSFGQRLVARKLAADLPPLLGLDE